MGIVRILSVIFSLVVLVIIGLSIFLLTLDPNQYKEEIVTAVKEQTGRTLDIKGDIALSIFPNLQLEIKDTTLSQPSNIQASNPFAELDMARIGLELLPILEGNINVNEISLIGPHIYLISNGNTNNWSFEKPGQAQKKANTQNQDAGSQASTSNFSITKLHIEDGIIVFEDRQARQSYRLENVDLSLRDFSAGRDAYLDVAALYSGGDMEAVIEGDMTFQGDLNTMQFNASKSFFDVGLKGDSIPNEDLRIVYSGAFDLDVAKESFIGNISSLKIGPNTLNGDVKVASFATPNIIMNVNADEFDVTSLMASNENAASNNNKQSAASAANPNVSPLAGLKNIKLDGQINIGALQLDTLKLTNVETSLGGQRGVITIEPMTFDFFGGKAELGALLNANDSRASYALEGVITSLKLGDLTSFLLDEASVSGNAKTEFNLSLKGNTPDQLKRSLSGFIDLDVDEGAISKWELSKRLNQVITVLQTGAMPEGGSDNFDFTSLLFDGAMNNGVFTSADLNLKSRALNATGSGLISLADDQINYTITPVLGEGIAAKSSVREIPIKISGPLSAPRYSIQLTEAIQGKAKEKIDELIDDKVKNKIDGVLGEGGTESLKKLLPF